MAPDIIFVSGQGGNGNPNDRGTFKGVGWGNTESFAANSITIGGKTTQHKAFTSDTNGAFDPITFKITEAITTAGDYDIIVTGEVGKSGAVTFDDYWTVTEGAGMNDLANCGDLTHLNSDKEERIDAIKQGLRVYNGWLEGYVTTFPHTMGDYPELTRKIVALLATSWLWFSDGPNEEYRKRSEAAWNKALELIGLIKHRVLKLELPDGTFLAFNASMRYTRAGHTGSFGVYDFWDEDLFDN